MMKSFPITEITNWKCTAHTYLAFHTSRMDGLQSALWMASSPESSSLWHHSHHTSEFPDYLKSSTTYPNLSKTKPQTTMCHMEHPIETVMSCVVWDRLSVEHLFFYQVHPNLWHIRCHDSMDLHHTAFHTQRTCPRESCPVLFTMETNKRWWRRKVTILLTPQ